MNARNKIARRRRQYWEAELARRSANKGLPPTHCQRCNKPFKSEWRPRLGHWTRCCSACGFNNLCDALDLPTPPFALDRHTKIPTLTMDEYKRKLNES